ncbi:MAG TPA: hypothetical protein VGH86_18530 [Phenylobacterium sp.]|jgi:hypothetical protein
MGGLRKHAVLLIATFFGLAGFAAFVVWAILATSHTGGGWASLLPIWPYVLGGVIATGALTGVLMWLAFYSANKGYDDRAGHEEP